MRLDRPHELSSSEASHGAKITAYENSDPRLLLLLICICRFRGLISEVRSYTDFGISFSNWILNVPDRFPHSLGVEPVGPYYQKIL
jgi:hypothetical protein